MPPPDDHPRATSGSAISRALAGIAGLGHITLTAGFVLMLLVLGRRIRLSRPALIEQAGGGLQ